MDIKREGVARRRRIRMAVFAAIGLGIAIAITVGLSKLQPAPPSVDVSTVWTDIVKRGDMDVQVRGLGTLVPVQIQWIPAVTEGRVERRFLLPGVKVTPDTALLQLSNPQLQQEAQNAQWTMKADEADLESLKAKLNNDLLNEQSTLTNLQSEYHQARMQTDVDAHLAAKGIVSDLTAQLSKIEGGGAGLAGGD